MRALSNARRRLEYSFYNARWRAYWLLSSTPLYRTRSHLLDEDEDLDYPIWPPPSPRSLLANRTYHSMRLEYRMYGHEKSSPGKLRPIDSLYRIYEYLLLDREFDVLIEFRCFWSHGWRVEDIPDPGEEGDPERYAVLACIPFLLAQVFNWRYRRGLFRKDGKRGRRLEEVVDDRVSVAAVDGEEAAVADGEDQDEDNVDAGSTYSITEIIERVPAWCEAVLPCDKTLYIPRTIDESFEPVRWQNVEGRKAFERKNVDFSAPFIRCLEIWDFEEDDAEW